MSVMTPGLFTGYSDFTPFNTKLNCTVILSYNKTEGNPKFDMSSTGEFGTLHFDGTNPAFRIGNDDTGIQFFLSKPHYEFGVVDDTDFMIVPAESMVSEFKASEYNSTVTGFGTMSVYADYYMTPYFGIDDKLVISFALDMPIPLLPKGAWVFQYMQIYDDAQVGGAANGLITFACTTQVGGEAFKVT